MGDETLLDVEVSELEASSWYGEFHMGLRVKGTFFELVALDDAQPARRAHSAPPAVARAGAAALPLGDLFEYETKRLEEAKPQPEVLHDFRCRPPRLLAALFWHCDLWVVAVRVATTRAIRSSGGS